VVALALDDHHRARNRVAFSIGAVLMILAGIVEIFLGVKAERRGLEDIAQPLTAEDPGTAPAPAAR
jgi:hypothetical protein